jgi:hypothetical protein
VTNNFLDCLNPEGGTDRLSRNVGNYQTTLRNIPEEPISVSMSSDRYARFCFNSKGLINLITILGIKFHENIFTCFGEFCVRTDVMATSGDCNRRCTGM